MKATLAPTPAKMAREMLSADRRARRARPVHTAPLIRPETFEPGNPPCPRGASSAQPREAASAKPQSVGSVARHTCRAASVALDLLLAAILWSTALVCVGLTLAIAAGIALRFFAS